MPRPLPLLLASLGLAAPTLAADELTPGHIAAIQHDEQKALERIEQAHGNRSPFEMTPEERREVIREQEAAKREVLERHRVDLKEYVLRSARLSREEKAQVEAARRTLAAEPVAPKPEPEPPPAPAGEVVIRRGFGEEEPVDVTEGDSADFVPPEGELLAGGDEAAAAALAESPPPAQEAPPAQKAPPKRRRGKGSR